MLQSTPLRGSTSSSAHFRPWIRSDTICHIPAWVHHIPGLFHHIMGPFHHRGRYCPLWAYHSLTGLALIPFVTSRPGSTTSQAHSTIVARYCPLWAYHLICHIPGPFHHCNTILSVLGLPFPHSFIFGNSRATFQWVTHHGSALASFSLNFGVPTELEASELPKCLMLERNQNIIIIIFIIAEVYLYSFLSYFKIVNRPMQF
ncbi:unnamed protein product [Malus baccata var. baccata]